MERPGRNVRRPDPDPSAPDTNGQVVREPEEGHGRISSIEVEAIRSENYAPRPPSGQDVSGAFVSDKKGADRRRHARLKKRYTIRFGLGDLAHHGYTQDVSENGANILASTIFPPNTILVMQIDYPEKTVALKGIVRWSKDLPPAFRRNLRGGMGVEFMAARAKEAATKLSEPTPAPPETGGGPAKAGSPPEADEDQLGKGATRRRQVSTVSGNTYEILQTELRGAVYVRVFQLPRTDGSSEAVLRKGYWSREEAEKAVKAFLKDR